MVFLSVIIPVYNEETRIQKLKAVFKYLKKKRFKSEVIVVNDGSTDKTLTKLNRLNKQFPFKVLNHPTNLGKGAAIKTGMLKASGRYRLFLDVDMSTPVEEFNKMMPYLKDFPVLIGTRKAAGSVVKRHQPWVRESLGRGFTYLSRKTLSLSVSDFTCGFKCFSKQAASQVFSRSRINRWGFDSEILFIAHKLSFKIKEIPVTWSHNQQTKVRFPQDMLRSFVELLTILVNNGMGKYD